MTEQPEAVSDTTVGELFARDPLSLSDADITQIIEKLRSQRKRFVVGDKSAGKPVSKLTAADKKKTAAVGVTGKLDLGDLGL